MIHLAAAPRGEEKGGRRGDGRHGRLRPAWGPRRSKAKSIRPSVPPSEALGTEVVRCGGGSVRDVRVRREEREG